MSFGSKRNGEYGNDLQTCFSRTGNRRMASKRPKRKLRTIPGTLWRATMNRQCCSFTPKVEILDDSLRGSYAFTRSFAPQGADNCGRSVPEQPWTLITQSKKEWSSSQHWLS